MYVPFRTTSNNNKEKSVCLLLKAGTLEWHSVEPQVEREMETDAALEGVSVHAQPAILGPGKKAR